MAAGDLNTYTMSGSVKAGKILGIGFPPREEAYELTVETGPGRSTSIIVPRWVDKVSEFAVGNFYCTWLDNTSQPIGSPFLLSAALFLQLTAPPATTAEAEAEAEAPAPPKAKGFK